MIPRRALAIAPVLLLAACAADPGAYPSLAPRAIEQRAVFAEPEREAAVAARDPALEARVDSALAAIAAGERDFAEAERALAGVGRPAAGSEAWIAAQQALTVLDAARQPVAAALGDLDALRLEAAQRPTPVDTTTLDAAYARAAALAERQRAAWQDAADRLPPG